MKKLLVAMVKAVGFVIFYVLVTIVLILESTKLLRLYFLLRNIIREWYNKMCYGKDYNKTEKKDKNPLFGLGAGKG